MPGCLNWGFALDCLAALRNYGLAVCNAHNHNTWCACGFGGQRGSPSSSRIGENYVPGTVQNVTLDKTNGLLHYEVALVNGELAMIEDFDSNPPENLDGSLAYVYRRLRMVRVASITAKTVHRMLIMPKIPEPTGPVATTCGYLQAIHSASP